MEWIVRFTWLGGAITVEHLGYRVRAEKPHLKLCLRPYPGV